MESNKIKTRSAVVEIRLEFNNIPEEWLENLQKDFFSKETLDNKKLINDLMLDKRPLLLSSISNNKLNEISEFVKIEIIG